MRKLWPLLILSTMALAGCGHDPFIHGPFLVGAEADFYAKGCRPPDVRAQDAQNGWDECMKHQPTHKRRYGTPIVMEPEVVVVAPVAPVAAKPGAGRSAWN